MEFLLPKGKHGLRVLPVLSVQPPEQLVLGEALGVQYLKTSNRGGGLAQGLTGGRRP